jgi:hypothetical protein
LALLEMPPFGKGSSDVVWALPCFGSIILLLAGSGLTMAILVGSRGESKDKRLFAGIVLNGLCLAVPAVALIFGLARARLLPGPG